jgi:hypothetical protein
LRLGIEEKEKGMSDRVVWLIEQFDEKGSTGLFVKDWEFPTYQPLTTNNVYDAKQFPSQRSAEEEMAHANFKTSGWVAIEHMFMEKRT